MTAFYKNMLDDTESEHAAAMAAAAKSEAKSLAIKPPSRDDDYEPEAEFDPYLQREAATSAVSSSTGKRVETNDEGEVVDNRTLLKAGLNIMKKPTAPLATAKATAAAVNLPYRSRAVGASASYKERMERERARLAEQVKAEAERVRREKEAALLEEEERARKRREGDDGEAERKRKEARERFLARKRQKVEPAAQEGQE